MQAMVLVQDESADGNLAAAAVAQRMDDGHVRPSGQNRRLPTSRSHDAPGGAHSAIRERFDDLRAATATDRRAVIAVAPPVFVLEIEARAGGDDADAARIVVALSPLRMVLPDHSHLA